MACNEVYNVYREMCRVVMDGESYDKTSLLERLQGSLDVFDDATKVVAVRAVNGNGNPL